jgi:hypothetical protein
MMKVLLSWLKVDPIANPATGMPFGWWSFGRKKAKSDHNVKIAK